MRALASLLFVLVAVVATATGARAAATVTLTLAAPTVAWTVNDFVNQFLPSTGGPFVVTGTLKAAGGAGLHSLTIGISAPAKLIGLNASNSIPISDITMTCSGAGNSVAPVYAAAHTPLVASATTTCATWSVASSTSVTLNFTIDLFLDDRTFPADTYDAATFAVVGTAL